MTENLCTPDDLQQIPTSAQSKKRPASQPASRPSSAATERDQAATPAADAEQQLPCLPGSHHTEELSLEEPVPPSRAPHAPFLSAAPFEPRAVARAATQNLQGRLSLP